MKKMFLLMMIALSTMMLVSCGDDDSDKSNVVRLSQITYKGLDYLGYPETTYTNFTYDSENRVSEFTRSNATGTYSYEGNSTRPSSYFWRYENDYDIKLTKIEYSYENDLLIGEKYYSSEGDEPLDLNYEIIYTYDNQKRLVMMNKEDFFYPEDNESTNWIYNDDSTLDKIIFTYVNRSASVYERKYYYDTNGVLEYAETTLDTEEIINRIYFQYENGRIVKTQNLYYMYENNQWIEGSFVDFDYYGKLISTITSGFYSYDGLYTSKTDFEYDSDIINSIIFSDYEDDQWVAESEEIFEFEEKKGNLKDIILVENPVLLVNDPCNEVSTLFISNLRKKSDKLTSIFEGINIEFIR
ncbi:MAG: hypothetical protein JXR48_02130 [Candidatus Delongbacteria bacterium]|nr:hypothetical protein [Candidatus Delongbacteria bacterium]MBN2833744.1 hypothetical protein [Candidatus Delongbacteria bacterium]